MSCSEQLVEGRIGLGLPLGGSMNRNCFVETRRDSNGAIPCLDGSL